jgi:magnesium-transporting ATPase (P-type)
MNKDV